MTEQLAKLEAAFRTLEPSARAAPPSEKALAKLVALTGPLAKDVRTLFRWGLAPRVFASSLLGMDGEEAWLSAGESASHLKDLRAVPAFPETFIPLASDGAGNFICFDARTGHITDWDHEARSQRTAPRSRPQTWCLRSFRAGFARCRRRISRGTTRLALPEVMVEPEAPAPAPTPAPLTEEQSSVDEFKQPSAMTSR